jgi:phosphoenolpyruvate carboxykinase (ATP)
LNPRNTWVNKDTYDQKANYLAEAFIKNFEQFSGLASEEILAAAPQVKVNA